VALHPSVGENRGLGVIAQGLVFLGQGVLFLYAAIERALWSK
jgi:hypothetical protein